MLNLIHRAAAFAQKFKPPSSGFFVARPERAFLRLECWMNKDKIATATLVLALLTAVVKLGTAFLALVKVLPF